MWAWRGDREDAKKVNALFRPSWTAGLGMERLRTTGLDGWFWGLRGCRLESPSSGWGGLNPKLAQGRREEEGHALGLAGGAGQTPQGLCTELVKED